MLQALDPLGSLRTEPTSGRNTHLSMSSKEGVKTREVQTRHRAMKDLRSGLKGRRRSHGTGRKTPKGALQNQRRLQGCPQYRLLQKLQHGSNIVAKTRVGVLLQSGSFLWFLCSVVCVDHQFRVDPKTGQKIDFTPTPGGHDDDAGASGEPTKC